MNSYIAFYRNQRHELMAMTQYEAQQAAAKYFKARKAWEVTVVLAEKNGEQVTHSTAMF